MTRTLTLYSKPGCHLCEVMKAVVARVIAGGGVRLDEVNIDLDAELIRRYGDQVPVLLLDGRAIAKYRMREADLRRALHTPGPPDTTATRR